MHGSEISLQTQIQAFYLVGEGPGRDKVDPAFSEGPYGFEVDVSG